jgi:adenylate cyclase
VTTVSIPTGTVTFLFTDVEGSTRLWEESREAMKFALARHDEILRDTIESRNGYVFTTGGDAFSAAFQAASGALESAIAAQLALQAEAWPGIDVRVRMAVHVGEAEERDGDYFGRTLNRTARVLSTAAGGEILVSSAIATVAIDSLPEGVDLFDLGERELEDLDRTEHVYRLTAPGLADADREVGVPTPDPAPSPVTDPRRSIAVLPFDVIGGDDRTEVLADGLVEDIISALSAWRHFPVTARNSTFAYRGQSVDVREVSQRLGVHFVLEGSLRRSGDQIRVAAQLIDGNDGHHVWADHYDGTVEDVFAFQDSITRNIASAIDPAIFAAEARRLASKPPASFDAWDHLVQGRRLVETARPDEVEEAIGHLQVAIGLDPGLAEAYTYTGLAHFFRGWVHRTDDDRAEFDKAIDWARRATEIDPNHGSAHEVLSLAYLFRGEHDRARNEARIALKVNPSSVLAHFSIGNVAIYSGDPKAALESFETCLQLDPLGVWAWVFHAITGAAHYLLGEYEEAIDQAREAIAIRSGYLLARVIITAGLARSGAVAEAEAELAEILSINPEFSVDLINQPFQPEHRADVIEGLRLAGLEGS